MTICPACGVGHEIECFIRKNSGEIIGCSTCCRIDMVAAKQEVWRRTQQILGDPMRRVSMDTDFYTPDIAEILND